MYFNVRLWAFTRGFRFRLLVGVIFGLLTAASGVSRLAMSGYVVALVFQGEPMSRISLAILGVVLSIMARGVFQYAKEMTGHETALRIQISLRRSLFSRALKLGPASLARRRTGDVIISLVEGVEQLESYFGEYLPQLFVGLITPVGLFVFMAFLDLPTALIYLLFAMGTLIAPAAFHRWNERGSWNRRQAYGEMSADFLDSVQGLATLKAFGQSAAKGDVLAERARKVFTSTMAILAANQATVGVTWLGIAGGAAVALGWGAVRVAGGDLELSTLLVVVMMGVEVFRPLRELTLLYHEGMLGMASAQAVFGLLDARPQVADDPDAADPAGPVEPSLSFSGVTFCYPGRTEAALTGIDLSLAPGETVAVVGPSGAGKSTLVWLAARFYDPTAGSVSIGGVDLSSARARWARDQVSLVTQDTYLFHGTVAENLRFGSPGASDAELTAAAEAANALSFIRALPDGFDTVIGERGVRLSGGQRQRIAIARALLKDAPILVLDEALSSVDAENEAAIQAALDRLMEDRTTLVVAHRLSSVVGADRIIALDQGSIVEQGSHDELMAAGGLYSSLMAAQVERTRPEVSGARAAGQTDERRAGSGPAAVAVPSARVGPFGVLGRLLKLVSPWRAQLAGTFLLGVGRVFVVVGLGAVSALVVRQVTTGADLTAPLIALGVLAALTPLTYWWESWVAHDMAFRLLAEMRIDVYRKLDRLAPAYLVRHRSGDIISAVTTDVETVELFFAHTIAPAFVAVAVPVSVLIVIGAIQWPLALILLPFLALVAYLPFRARDDLDDLGLAAREQLGEVNAHMVDGIQGMREILAFGREPDRLAEVTTEQRRYGVHRMRFFRLLTAQRAMIEVAMGLGGIAVLGTGAYLASEGAMPFDLLPLVAIIAYTTFLPISEVAQVGRQLADTLGSSRRIFSIHDEPVPVADGPGATARGRGAVALRDVGFSYGPGLAPALSGVNFEIEPGQTVALIGRSGAGKTTAAHLMMRFWDPQEGTISLDGADIRDYRLDELRSQVSLVAQDTYLFNSSIRDNLLIARPGATDEEMVAAARSAAAHEFIASLPDGYDTVSGERGMQLSGGQRQRIAIARAFLKNSPILILDEATSHLDAESEALIHASLEELMAGRSTLVIAHRLSTVRAADKIVVLDDGRVKEQGDHAELLGLGGIYAKLVAAQISSARS